MRDDVLDEHLDEELRQALTAEAHGVAAGPELLARIAAKSGSTVPHRRPVPWLLAAAVVAVVAGLGAVALNAGRTPQRVEILDPPDPTTSTSARDTTTTAPVPSSTAPLPSTTTTMPTGPKLLIRADGLGAVPFGTPIDEAMPTLVAWLGEPEEDTGEIPFEESCAEVGSCASSSGVCATSAVWRGVRWPALSLSFYGASGAPEFASWSIYRFDGQSADARITTEAGLRVIDPLSHWQDAYGDAFETRLFQESELPPGQWTDRIELQFPEGRISGYTDSGAPPEFVGTLYAGVTCGLSDY